MTVTESESCANLQCDGQLDLLSGRHLQAAEHKLPETAERRRDDVVTRRERRQEHASAGIRDAIGPKPTSHVRSHDDRAWKSAALTVLDDDRYFGGVVLARARLSIGHEREQAAHR